MADALERLPDCRGRLPYVNMTGKACNTSVRSAQIWSRATKCAVP